MVNQQGTDQGDRSPAAPPRKRTSAKKQPPFWLKLLVTFTHHHPFLLWSGVWLLMVSLTWVGVRSLIHIDPGEVETPQPGLVADAPQTQKPPQFEAKPASSFGLLVAIALGCGGMSFLLAKQLTPTKPQPRLVTRPKLRSPKVRTAISSSDPQGVVPKSQTPILQAAAPVVTRPPTVTVVPSEEAHPLDWGDASLADMMDIRKQKSISSLM
ncbi:hypothetical protein [Phormidesmis priestleyi]